MPRKNREYSSTYVYHIIFRGNDKQDMFYDDQDRCVFLDRIKEAKKIFNFDIFSYCLMDNHVHMVIRVKDKFLSKSMQSLGVRYSIYFNRKYNRRGHLFENRYLSKKIESLNYFLNLCKYIHRNPENADMEKTENYKWSSYSEYINKKDRIIKSDVLLHYYYDDVEEFKNFTLQNNKMSTLTDYAEYELISKLTEDDLINIIKEKFNLENASDVSLLEKNKIEEIIYELKNVKCVSLNQIARVTKVTRYHIKKIWQE